MELFIPARIHKDDVFGNGFGKRDLRRTIIGTLFGLGLGLALGLIRFNQNFQSILIATVIGGGVSAVFSYFICLKNSVNLSVYDLAGLMLKFYRSQRLYLYQKNKEWC